MKIPAFSAALALALLAATGASAESAAPPTRMTSLTVYGNDACPKGDGDEIVVCAHEPESERYRIPKRFRQKPTDESADRSWTDRVAVVEEASRPARPNSCSVVGASGQSGCTQAMLRQWFADKRAAKQEATDIP
ncbi:MAG: hypothetical protein JWR77_1132 [Rhizorhabdus sp.]|nr:hypothetical protein [Rhizorhabdus sp.]